MSYRAVIHPEYEHLQAFLLHVKEHFAHSDKSIHKARNELRIIEYKCLNMVVKSFKIPHLINRIAYAYLRDSKAKKSYFNAVELQKRGINTPAPVGYIEFLELGLLKESFFISLEQPYNFTIREAFHHKIDNYKDILTAFALFTYKVHQAGIWHVDYSPGNVLVMVLDEGFDFSLVDINRMEFKTITPQEGLTNFSKFYAKEEDLKLLATTYAKAADIDENEAITTALQAAKSHVEKNEFKKRLKGKK